MNENGNETDGLCHCPDSMPNTNNTLCLVCGGKEPKIAKVKKTRKKK